MVLEKVVDGLGGFTHNSEYAASDTPVGDLAKEALHEVEP